MVKVNASDNTHPFLYSLYLLRHHRRKDDDSSQAICDILSLIDGYRPHTQGYYLLVRCGASCREQAHLSEVRYPIDRICINRSYLLHTAYTTYNTFIYPHPTTTNEKYYSISELLVMFYNACNDIVKRCEMDYGEAQLEFLKIFDGLDSNFPWQVNLEAAEIISPVRGQVVEEGVVINHKLSLYEKYYNDYLD